MPSLVVAASDAPVPKEVVFAILGAAAGVAGLVLVFLGVVLAAIAGFPGDTPDKVTRPFRRAAWYATGVFALGLVTVATGLVWAAMYDGRLLYYGTIALFGGLLLAALILAIRVVREVV